MKDEATKERFMELRVEGKGFTAIAEELGVSKTTLISWSKERAIDIQNLQEIRREALFAKHRLTHEARMERYAKQLDAIEQELETRDLADVPTHKLYDVLMKLHKEVKREERPFTLQMFREPMTLDWNETEPYSWQA
jgi:uncharacterized protein YjcR